MNKQALPHRQRAFLRCATLMLLILKAIYATTYPSMIAPMDFEVIKQEKGAPTLLIIGGIQGDEPGGFNATNMFLNHYTITQGSVWVVPVLNMHSMLLNHRGIYNDMNRKFATIAPNDPEKPIIEHIKRVISDKQVSAVLHLHDGSGYYRPTFESKLANPNRWGNCTVIDQVLLEGASFGKLEEVATNMIHHINANLLAPIHRYHLHNTETAEKDKEMQKALTFYAISQGKPGYANEASKELNVANRVYYHLLAIESLLMQMGITFTRDFPLTPAHIQRALRDEAQSFALENLPAMPLIGLQKVLHNLPLPAHAIRITSENKILGLVPKGNALLLKYGNNVMTTIIPKHMPHYQGALPPIRAMIDGKEQEIHIGSTVQVKHSAQFPKTLPLSPSQRLAIRIIGQQSNTPIITKSSLLPQASISKNTALYRVELYVQESNTQQSAQSLVQSSHTAHTDITASKTAWAFVSVHLANVREGVGIDSSIVAKAPLGRVLEVLESSNDIKTQEQNKPPNKQSLSEQAIIDTKKENLAHKEWVKVRYIAQGKIIQGYILKELIAPLPHAHIAHIAVNMANVREGVGIDSSIVAKAPLGRVLEVLESSNDIKTQEQNHSEQAIIDTKKENLAHKEWVKVRYIAQGKIIQGYILKELIAPLQHMDTQALRTMAHKKTHTESFAGMILLEFLSKESK